MLLFQLNLQTVGVVAPLPEVGGGGGGTYPGYAAERSVTNRRDKQDRPPEATKAAQVAPITQAKAITPVYPLATDRQALRRVVNEAMREKQLQALGQFSRVLQAQQASQEQQQAEIIRRLQVLDNNNDDAMIALLLTI